MYEAELAKIREYADSLPVPNSEMKDVEFLKASIRRWAAQEIETRIVGEIQFTEAFYPNVVDPYVPCSPEELVCWYILEMEYCMNIHKVPSADMTFMIAHEVGCDILKLIRSPRI